MLLDEFDRSRKTLADLKKVLKLRGIRRRFQKIRPVRSRSQDLVQIADWVAGSILRRYARQDVRAYRVIEPKVQVLFDFQAQKPPWLAQAPEPEQAATVGDSSPGIKKLCGFLICSHYTLSEAHCRERCILIVALVSCPLVDSQGHPLDRQALETARDLFAEIGLTGGVEWVEGIMQQLNLSGGEE